MEYLLGVAVSLVVEGIKKWQGTKGWLTFAVLLILSVAFGAVYVWAKDTSFWPTIVLILSAAAAFHNLVIRALESK